MGEESGTSQPRQAEQAGIVREATPDDLPALLQLAAERRAQYARYQPTFWREAAEAAQLQEQFFGQVFSEPGVLALVVERAGTIEGFLIAALIPPPPVYAQRGPVCSIEDVWVAGGKDWDGAGRALLDAATQAARESDAVQMTIVGARQDEGLRAMLAGADYHTVSEQWLASL